MRRPPTRPFAAPREPRPPLGRDRVGRRPRRRPRGGARPRRRAAAAPELASTPSTVQTDRPAPPGSERSSAATCSRPTTGLALFDCGPTTCMPALKAGLAERGLELARRPPPPALAHPPRPRGRRGRARPRAPWAPGARLRDRRAAPRRPDAGSRRARGGSTATRSTTLWGELAPVPEENVHVVGDERRRARVLPDARPRLAPRLVPRTRRNALRRRRGRRPDRARPPSCCPSRPPPDIDFEAWEPTLDEIERRAARAARADPLRRRRRRPGSTSRSPTQSERVGRRSSAKASDQEEFAASGDPSPRRRGRGRPRGAGHARSGSHTWA